MKIAISARGSGLNDEVDPRFGRAAYILIVDCEDFHVEVIDNMENVRAFKGAGIQAATRISRYGVAALLTGYCGPNAFKTLEAAGIRVVQDVSGIVRDAVNGYIGGEFEHSSNPNAEGHW